MNYTWEEDTTSMRRMWYFVVISNVPLTSYKRDGGVFLIEDGTPLKLRVSHVIL